MEDRILGHTGLGYKRDQKLDNMAFVNIFGYRELGSMDIMITGKVIMERP